MIVAQREEEMRDRKRRLSRFCSERGADLANEANSSSLGGLYGELLWFSSEKIVLCPDRKGDGSLLKVNRI